MQQKLILGMPFFTGIRAVVTLSAKTINTNKLTKTMREVLSIDAEHLINSTRATFLEAKNKLIVERLLS
jgi:hypothetical protein